MMRRRYELMAKIAFIFLVVFSIFFTSYTLYLFYGTKFALNGLGMQLSNVKITNGPSGMHALLQLELKNSYWVGLKIKFISYKLTINNVAVGAKQQYFVNPVNIPPYSTQRLNLSLAISGNVKVNSRHFYVLQIKIYFITPFSKNAEISRSISKVM